MQYCYTSQTETNCTEDCRQCLREELKMKTQNQAKEIYRDLKGMTGKADYVSEEAIRNDLGDEAFEALKQYGYIEYCTAIHGRKMYAI